MVAPLIEAHISHTEAMQQLPAEYLRYRAALVCMYDVRGRRCHENKYDTIMEQAFA